MRLGSCFLYQRSSSRAYGCGSSVQRSGCKGNWKREEDLSCMCPLVVDKPSPCLRREGLRVIFIMLAVRKMSLP